MQISILSDIRVSKEANLSLELQKKKACILTGKCGPISSAWKMILARTPSYGLKMRSLQRPNSDVTVTNIKMSMKKQQHLFVTSISLAFVLFQETTSSSVLSFLKIPYSSIQITFSGTLSEFYWCLNF